ncbi:hypothetical protein BH11CYA1_BH11CYA1_41430 [soil metagenome]
MQLKLVLLLITVISNTLPVAAGPIPARPSPAALMQKSQAAQKNQVKFTKLPAGKAFALQQSSLILGEYDVLINSLGVKASCKRSGITFVAVPPLWNPVGYSTFSKSIWKSQRANFSPINDTCKSLPMLGLPSIWLIPVEHSGQKVSSGFNCETFATTPAWSNEQAKSFKQGLIQNTAPVSAKYEAANVGLPAPACQVLEKIFGTPSCSFLPIHFTFLKFNKNSSTGLETFSCHVVTPAKDWLDTPTNYKTVKTFGELNMDKGSQAGAEILFGP